LFHVRLHCCCVVVVVRYVVLLALLLLLSYVVVPQCHGVALPGITLLALLLLLLVYPLVPRYVVLVTLLRVTLTITCCCMGVDVGVDLRTGCPPLFVPVEEGVDYTRLFRSGVDLHYVLPVGDLLFTLHAVVTLFTTRFVVVTLFAITLMVGLVTRCCRLMHSYVCCWFGIVRCCITLLFVG